jgi:hypothetical protein
MIGGIIIEVAETDNKIFVDVHSTINTQTIGILLEKDENSSQIEIGDLIWWHGKYAFWTPAENHTKSRMQLRCNFDYDVQLNKIGPSGVILPNRPQDRVYKG